MSILRHPKTTQERRASFDGYCRAKRNFSNLPDAWDDFWRYGYRCWKRYRKTQYKTVDKFNRKKKDSSKYAKAMAKREHFHLEHKRCSYKRFRCSYCIKNDVWKEYDAYIRREQRRYREKEQRFRECFWKRLRSTNDDENISC
jgi:hypothetical protein